MREFFKTAISVITFIFAFLLVCAIVSIPIIALITS